MSLSLSSIILFGFLAISTVSGQGISAKVQLLAPVADGANPAQPRSFGTLTITEDGNTLTFEGTISGLPEGQHGFHVHQNGDLGQGCNAAGSHFNPYGRSHGAPTAAERHVGDLGNINLGAGDTQISVRATGISLHGPNSILGRSVVIHENADDLGLGGTPDSATTGNAGARIACGVIGIVDPTPPCADTDPNCAAQAANCMNPANEKDLIRRCRKTCGYCDCRDANPSCAQLERLCTVPQAQNVRDQCMLTCGLCNCKDLSTDCFQQRMHCENPLFQAELSRKCRKTCGKC